MSAQQQQQQHTAECLAHQAAKAERVAAYERNVAAFDAAHPTVCKSCGGTGIGGSSYSYEDGPDQWPCGTCVENGICPRCGQAALDEDGNDCSHCPYRAEDQATWLERPYDPRQDGGPECVCPEPSYIPDYDDSYSAAWRVMTEEQQNDYLRRSDEAYDAWRARQAFGRGRW